MATIRPRRIGEVRPVHPETGEIARTRRGNFRLDVETETLTAQLQVDKLARLSRDPVTNNEALRLAVKAAGEGRRCLTRAEKALKALEALI